MRDTCREVFGLSHGHPWHPRTFSGVSRHLFSALRDEGWCVNAVNTFALRPSDFLNGCLEMSRGHRAWRPRISRGWLWRADTVAKMSARVAERLRCRRADAIVLQVGTHVYTMDSSLRHFCFTDMTVAQAAEVGRFGMERFQGRALRVALDVQKRIFDSCEVVFTATDWARASVVSDFGQDPRRVVTVGEGASVDPIGPSDSKYTNRRVLFVGYEWETKGGPLLLDALRIVAERFPDVTLSVVGCRPKLAFPNVRVHGVLRKTRKSELARLRREFAEATCLCLLSEVEAFGLVLVEAQMAATPVVALDRGSRREVVIPGVTGLLVNDARPGPVAHALLELLGSPDTAARMGWRAREFASAHFTWHAVVRRMLRHII